MKQLFLFLAFLLPFCAYAQLNEPFNNPDITYNFPWKGDLDRFVTENGFLRLSHSNYKASSLVHLYGATLSENEWTFRIKSGHQTTAYNLFRIYLWSSKTDLNDHPLAYYVEFGNGGTISFIKTTGNNVTEKLISKQVPNLSKAFDIHIRIVADNNKITLFARSDAKPDYTEIGSTPYIPQTVPGYLMLYCKYTSAYAQNKYFGPISIKDFSIANPPSQTDLTLLSLEQDDASSLILTFNRPINPRYASFSLTTLGEVDEIYISDDETQLKLVWREKMQKGKTYSLTYKNLHDLANNAFDNSLPPFVATIGATEPEVIEPTIPSYFAGDIIINEVMANPQGASGLPETEYIELFNTTDKAIDLTGWSFIYADKGTTLKSTIPAKGYAVLFREGRDIEVDRGGISIPLSTFPSALANTGKQLSLKAKNGTTIDNIDYPSVKPGFSWERTKDSWQYSFDKRGGTPGSINSNSTPGSNEEEEEEENKIIPMPHEIIISELLPEPQTGGSEYIELYNRSDRALPVSGLSVAIRKNDDSLDTFYPLSSITKSLDAGEYIVLAKSIAGVRDFFLVPSSQTIHELKLPVLANTTSQLVLFRSEDDEVIDEVHYSEKWHSTAIKERKGIALERINLDGESQDPDNWTSASALSGGGTPGYANSQSGKNPEEPSTGINTPEYLQSTGNYEIAYRLDKSGYICRANIYDTSGRKVAEIANHELLGTEGVFSWNGLGSGSTKITTGVYIFHAELYHPQGGKKTYKKVFLIR